MKTASLISLLFIFLHLPGTGFSQSTTADSTVSLDLRDMSLRDALLELQKKASVRIVFADNLLDGKDVNVVIKSSTIQQALQSILINSGLTAKQVADSRFVIVAVPREYVTISGYVSDKFSNERLPFASITLNDGKAGTATNRDGFFAILNIPPDIPCTLTVDYLGYRTVRKIISAEQAPSPVIIELSPKAIAGSAVEVNAYRNRIIRLSHSASGLSISTRHFKTLPGVGEKDIFRSLQLMPGVLSGNDGDAAAHIRGGLPAENLVLLDGIPIYHLEHAFGFLSAFNVNAVKDVKLMKSGYPARYGGRLSSVLDMTTKNGNTASTTVHTFLNPLNSGILAEGPIFNVGSWMTAARRSYSNYILGDVYKRYVRFSFPQQLTGANAEVDGDTTASVDYFDVLAKLTLLPSPNNSLSLSFYASKDDTRFTSDILTNGLFFIEPLRLVNDIIIDDNADWGNLGASVRWYSQWSPAFSQTVTAARSIYKTEESGRFSSETSFGLPDSLVAVSTTDFDFFYKSKLSDFRLKLENSWQFKPDHLLSGGIEYSQIDAEFEATSESDERFLVNDSSGFESFETTTNGSAKRTAFFLEDKWTIHPRLELVPGLRIVHRTLSLENLVEPRMSATVDVTGSLALKGAYGIYHQYLTQVADSLPSVVRPTTWIQNATRSFQPEKSAHLIFGLKYENDVFLLDAEIYNKTFRKRLILNSLYYSQFRLADVLRRPFSRGLDLLAQLKEGVYTGWLSYSFNQSRFSNAGRAVPLETERPHATQIAAIRHFGLWKTTATWQFTSGKPYAVPAAFSFQDSASSSPAIDRLPLSHRLDIALTREFSFQHIHATLNFSVANIYNKKNIWLRFFTDDELGVRPVDITSPGILPSVALELKL